MGLDAHVRCNCAREGKHGPCPFPGRLRFDETGEPVLADINGKTPDLSEDLVFDKWVDGCEHEGMFIRAWIGNIAGVRHIREWVKGIETQIGTQFPILMEKVVYSGIHAGDWLRSEQTKLMAQELEVLRPMIQDDYHQEFVKTMQQLYEASITTGNPIVF